MSSRVSTSPREVLRMFLAAHETEDGALYNLALELARRLAPRPGFDGVTGAALCPSCGRVATTRFGARLYCAEDAARLRAKLARTACLDAGEDAS